MRALFLSLMLFAPLAHADREVRQGADWVRLHDSACVSAETLARIPAAARDQFSKAQGMHQGQLYFGCWREVGNVVHILWEDGDEGVIPVGILKLLPEA